MGSVVYPGSRGTILRVVAIHPCQTHCHAAIRAVELTDGQGAQTGSTTPAATGYRPAMRNPGRYRYVGPAELQDERPSMEAVNVGSRAVLDRWLAGQTRAELDEPFTFVVALDGSLRVAPRRSEHVALATGRNVLAAGEITFAGAAGARTPTRTVGTAATLKHRSPRLGPWILLCS